MQRNENSGDFLSIGKDLELQKEELVTGSSIKTIESCDLNFDNLAMLAGTTEDNPSLGVVLNEDEQLKEDEIVMSHVQKFVVVGGREEFACLNSQEKTVR